MLRIGIPHAIHYYQHFPLLKTFFEVLGEQVVISPPTNREIVTVGARTVADVTCLPVKIYAGHVAWLRDHGQVDYTFAPAIWSIEPSGYHCAKLKALPDILRATLPDCPSLLDIDVDPREQKITLQQAFLKLGRRLGAKPALVRRAWEQAGAVDRQFQEQIVARQITYAEALECFENPECTMGPAVSAELQPLTIGVVGHPYCLHDDYANHGLLKRLRALGVRVLTGEMVPAAQAAAGVTWVSERRRWFYESVMSGAAGHFLQDPQVDGVIVVLAFACGPDSTMAETIMRRAHALERPLMSLVLDEHGSATGMMTRLEAFADMLNRQKQLGLHKPVRPAQPTHEHQPQPVHTASPVLRSGRMPVVGLPRLGTTYIPLQSLLRGIGAQVEMGPMPSKRTVSLGGLHSPEFICTPYKQILGSMIEMLEAGADTLIYVDGEDLCRNSNYALMMRDALRDLGYKFQLITFSQIFEGGVFALPSFLAQFAPDVSWSKIVREIWLALGKMRALDALEVQVQSVRPREVTPGTVDKVWAEAIQRVDGVRSPAALKLAQQDLLCKIHAVPQDPTRRPVRVATTGEYYAILDPFYNLDLEIELGRLGAEVHRTLMMSDWLRGAMILEAVGFPRRPEIQKAARPYLRWDVSGEGWVTIGQTVIHAREGFDGMVETMPFTCEPEVTALNILPKVARDYGIPVITFVYDEQTGKAGMRTRLEAFVDLLYRRRQVQEGGRKVSAPACAPNTARLALCPECPVSQTCPVPHNNRASLRKEAVR